MQVVLLLYDFVLCNFALMRLENLHHILTLRDSFWFNAIWHRRSVVTLVFCRRLAGSDVTVTPSVGVWIDYVGHIAMWLIVFCSTALAFLSNMSEKCKSASPSAIQVKNWRKTISIVEKLDIINQLVKGG
jgi:hypothetical protein